MSPTTKAPKAKVSKTTAKATPAPKAKEVKAPAAKPKEAIWGSATGKTASASDIKECCKDKKDCCKDKITKDIQNDIKDLKPSVHKEIEDLTEDVRQKVDGEIVMRKLCHLFDTIATKYPEIGLSKISLDDVEEQEKIHRKMLIEDIAQMGFVNVEDEAEDESKLVFLKMIFLDDQDGSYHIGYVNKNDVQWTN